MKTILITGGTSGLGLALATQFIKKGAHVAIVARGRERLHAIKKHHPQIEVIEADISNKEDVHRIYAESLQKLGYVDILINNASSLGPHPLKPLIDTECEEFLKAIETNLLGAFRLTKLVLSSMLLRHSGLIVNISSDAAVQNYAGWGAYSVSKSALDHMTRIFAAELPQIRFMSVDPGDMDTPLQPSKDRSSLYRPEDSARLLIERIESGNFNAEHRGLR